MAGKNFKSNKPLDTISQNKQIKASTELKQPENQLRRNLIVIIYG